MHRNDHPLRHIAAELRLDHLSLAVFYRAPVADIERAYALLGPLAVYHPPTAAHCMRVGMLAGDIASALDADSALAILGGTIHDIGKIACPHDLLDASSITPQEYERIKPHVEIGYRMAAGLLPEAAEALKHHHRFQQDPYPTVLLTNGVVYSADSRERHERLGRIIALSDFVDALRTRDNDRFGNQRMSAQEKRDCLRERNTDVTPWIEKLLDDHVIYF